MRNIAPLVKSGINDKREIQMTIKEAEKKIKDQVRVAARQFEDLAISISVGGDSVKEDKEAVVEGLVTNIMRIVQAIGEEDE